MQSSGRKSGAGEESARVHSVYAQQVKRFQSEFARIHGLQNPHQRPFKVEQQARPWPERTGEDQWGFGVKVGSNPMLADPVGHPASRRQARGIQRGLLSGN